MLGLEVSGNLSVSGLLLAILCIYLLGGRLIRIYLFQNTGRSIMRPRPVVQVLVVGDIGRSPRMRYHAVSLADAGCTVDLIGYTGKQKINPTRIKMQGLMILMGRNIRGKPDLYSPLCPCAFFETSLVCTEKYAQDLLPSLGSL